MCMLVSAPVYIWVLVRVCVRVHVRVCVCAHMCACPVFICVLHTVYESVFVSECVRDSVFMSLL